MHWSYSPPSPCSPQTYSPPLLSQLCVLLIYFSCPFVLLKSSWMCGPPLECSNLTKGDSLRENCLSISQQVKNCHWSEVFCPASSFMLGVFSGLDLPDQIHSAFPSLAPVYPLTTLTLSFPLHVSSSVSSPMKASSPWPLSHFLPSLSLDHRYLKILANIHKWDTFFTWAN